jgi:hypothetical protein
MARTIFIPGVGAVVEDGEEEYFIPSGGVFSENQAAAPGGATPKGPFGHPFHGPLGGPTGD